MACCAKQTHTHTRHILTNKSQWRIEFIDFPIYFIGFHFNSHSLFRRKLPVDLSAINGTYYRGHTSMWFFSICPSQKCDAEIMTLILAWYRIICEIIWLTPNWCIHNRLAQSSIIHNDICVCTKTMERKGERIGHFSKKQFIRSDLLCGLDWHSRGCVLNHKKISTNKGCMCVVAQCQMVYCFVHNRHDAYKKKKET